MTLLTFFALNFLGSFKTSFHTRIWSDVINCHVYAIKKTKSNRNSPWCFDKVRKGQQIKCKFSSWFISFLCYYRFWLSWYKEFTDWYFSKLFKSNCFFRFGFLRINFILARKDFIWANSIWEWKKKIRIRSAKQWMS